MARTFANTKRETKVNVLNVLSTKEVVNLGTEMLQHKTLVAGTITKENFLKMGKVLLPEVIRRNPLAVLALNYNCDSKVGQWTNMAMNICTALPDEFIEKEGKGANKKFFKAFKCASKTGHKIGYDSIFKQGLNIHSFTLKVDDGFKVTAYYVSNREVRMFADQIASLKTSELTVEDVIAIQADLWYLFRAWQESSIDMVKDKAKQFAVAMDEVLGSVKVRTGVKFQDIKTNDYAIKAAKYDKDLETPAIEIDFAEYDDDEDDEFVETRLSEMQHSIREVAEVELQVFANAYVNHANVSVLERYVRFAKDYPELALTIMDLYKIVKDYNNVSAEEKSNGKKLTNRDYALLRAIAYNDAAELGIAFEDVVAVGLGVAVSDGVYTYTNYEGEEVTVIKEFNEKVAAKQLYCAERLFGNIIVLEKGIMYESDMIVDGLYIKQEIEPRHVFEDVSNGRYTISNGDVYAADGTLLFDTRSELSGEVVVDDNGVYYLYDPLTEVDNIPEIDAIFTSNAFISDLDDNDNAGRALEVELNKTHEYTLANDTIIMNDLEVAYVDSDYAVGEDNSITTTVTKWYGVSGVRHRENSEDKPLQRNNVFCLLSYDVPEVDAYLSNIIDYIG